MSAQLKAGDPAPDFQAIAVSGEEEHAVSLGALRDKTVVLYFYPKDDTPGCTKQACGLRDSWGEFKSRAHVFGVSADSAGSHRKFISKFNLPFPLLSDPDRKIVNDYGVWVEKSFMGKKHMGIERSTFVIDTAGRIAAVLRKVKPEEHVDLLHEALSRVKGK